VRPLGALETILKRRLKQGNEPIELAGGAPCAQATVMVVDDEKFQFEFVSKMLKGEPYRFVFASSAPEAMKMLRRDQPDLLLMDIKMPRMDGMGLMRWMKSFPKYANIPIIMMTSNSQASVVEASLRAGATDFMVKPLSRKALISKIGQILGGKSGSANEQVRDPQASEGNSPQKQRRGTS
jgi:two-component system response regulator MtrA